MEKTTESPGCLAAFRAWLGISAVTLLAYIPAIHGRLVWDDDAHVTKPSLQSLHGLKRIWLELGATQQYYPVLHSAFWVEHRLWGDSVVGYHLANILLHATAAFLFGVVLQRLFDVARASLPASSSDTGWKPVPLSIPWLAALIFALHPVCVESVAWISEQKNTLSTVFYLLAALTYLRWEGGGGRGEGTSGLQPPASDLRPRALRWYLAALIFFIAALLSKSVTATLPAALLVVLWWKRGSLSWKRDVLPLLPWLAIGMAGGLLTAWVEQRYIGARGTAFELGGLQRCLLAGRVIWFYLAKLFWPANLMFVYPRWQVNAGVWWQYLFPLGAAALLAALWALRRRARGPLAGALFFVGSLFPALGFFNVYPFVFSYVADHFQYLASMGVIAAVAGGWGMVDAASRRVPGDTRRAAASTFLALVLLSVLGALTWRQCRAYRDVETLYRATLQKNPNSWMPHYNLGIALARDGRLPDAIAEYERALEFKPEMSDIHLDLGSAFVRAGRVAEAIAQFEEAVRLKPDYADAHLNLGGALKEAGRIDEAIAQCEEALRLRPDFPEADYNLGVLFQGAGRLPEAISQFRRALQARPGFPEANRSLADALEQNSIALAGAGRLPEAAAQLGEALRLDPGNALGHYNLGLALAQEGRLQEAKAEFGEALRLNPEFREARDSLLQLQALGPPARARADAPAPFIEKPMRENPKAGRPRKAKTLIFLQAAAIVLAGWWIYSPAFHGGWLWDDNTNITENSLMRDPAALGKIWFAPQSLDYYPLQMSVEWLQWRLWGMDTFGYHLTNVVLQVLNGFLLWHVLRKLGLRFAWLGGLLLVVHPMTVESVAWIVEVKNTMSLAFLLLAMSAWIDWDRRSGTGVPPVSLAPGRDARATPALLYYVLALLCFLAAMLSKASVVMFPAVLLLYAWWRRGRIARRDLAASAPFFAVSLALGVAALWLQQHRAIATLVVPMGGVFSRLAVAGLAAAFYFWKFVMPAGLTPIYPRWNVDPPSVVQFLPWLAIGGLAWLLWKTNRRGVLFALGFFLLNLVPVSGLFTVSFMRLTWVMDHLAYVPLVGLIGLAVAGMGSAFEVAQALAAAERSGDGSSPASSKTAGGTPALLFIVTWAAIAAIVAALACESHAYARTFSSGRAYWTSAVERNPGAWAAHYNLALILAEAGEFPEAIAHLEEAVRLDPDYTEAHVNLASALCQTGRYEEAVPHFERALQLDPSSAVAHYNFGLALRALGRSDEARAQLLEAARLARR